MAKYLMVNSDTDFPQDWRLPASVDEEKLNASLQRAMRKGDILEIPIEVGHAKDKRSSILLLNGGKIATVAIVELVSPPPAFRLLGGHEES